MWPVLFKIGDLPVTNYGNLHLVALIALAFFGAVWFRRNRADGSVAVDAAIAFPFALFILGRILFVLMEYGFTRKAWTELPDLLGGGFWGGLAFLILILGAYTVVRRFPFWTTMDLFAPLLLLTQTIVKVGCFLGGCCWGGSSGAWFGLTLHPDCPKIDSYPEGPLHPVPLYDSIWAALGMVLLILWSRRRPLPGYPFLISMIWYAGGRFLTEFLRHDYIGKTEIQGLYASQLVELGAMVTAVVLIVWRFLTRKSRHRPEVPGRFVRDRELPTGYESAGSARRTFAFAIDIAPVLAVITLALLAGGRFPGAILGMAGLLYVAIQAMPARTPGMALLGLVAIDFRARKASFIRRLLRSLLLPVPLVVIVGIFRPIVSSSRQAFHDMVAGVYIVKAPR